MEFCDEIRIPLIIVGVFLLVFVFWWFLVKPLSYWKKRGIPCIPAVPFSGSMPLFFWKSFVGDAYASMYSQLEGKRYGGFHKFSKPSILLRDPEIIRNVLENSFDSFHDNDFEPTALIDSAYEHNLAFLKGDDWERLRGNIASAFSSSNVKNFVPLILEVCEVLEDCVSTKVDSVLDLMETGQCYVADVVSSIAFGTRGDSMLNPGGKFRRMARKISDRSLLRLLFISSGPRLLRPLMRTSPRAVGFFRGMVEEAIRLREEEKVKRPDFLHVLVELQKQKKLGTKEEDASEEKHADAEEKDNTKEWSEEALNNVTAQAMSFFVNGMNTTANTISFCLLELAHNPEVQEKARSEVEKVLEFHGSMSADALLDMPFLETVLLETLRKYPPSAYLARSVTKRYLLPSPDLDEDKEESEADLGLWLEEGDSVIIPILGIHTDPQYYPNPEIFDTEHFSDKNLGKRSRFSFLGFGKGPRICIGMKIGLLQVKAAVATLLAKYEFLPSEKTSLPVIFNPDSLTTAPKDGAWVKVASLKKKF